MIACLVLLVVGFAVSIVFIVDKVRHYSLRSIIIKTVAGLFFVALAITAVCLNESDDLTYELLILFGLFFGLLGDIFLGFKYISKRKKLFIALGLFSFACGHVLYSVALYTRYYIAGDWLSASLPVSIAVSAAFLYVLYSKKFGLEFGKLKPAVFFYISVLLLMASCPLFLMVINEREPVTLLMFVPAGICFAISDFMLSGSYFGKHEKSKAYQATYSVFYYIAQFIIAFSLLYLPITLL